MTDREIHAPGCQTGMHRPTARPACWTDAWPLPIRAPAFWDGGRGCACAATPQLWKITLHHTPTCHGCARAMRALTLRAGIAEC